MTPELTDAFGAYDIDTPDGVGTLDSILSETDSETYDSPEAVRTEIEQCLENIRALQVLGETVQCFPEPLFGLEFRHLEDATIIETTGENPTAPFNHSLERFRSASQYRGLTNTSPGTRPGPPRCRHPGSARFLPRGRTSLPRRRMGPPRS